MSTFIAQSSANLQPDYQQLSAYLLFDQINIQRAIANGTSLDRITTSGADPTAHFTPKYLDSWINALWLTSLTLSLATALFAMLADEWYCHYLSPSCRRSPGSQPYSTFAVQGSSQLACQQLYRPPTTDVAPYPSFCFLSAFSYLLSQNSWESHS